jgi:hypothetical protein
MFYQIFSLELRTPIYKKSSLKRIIFSLWMGSWNSIVLYFCFHTSIYNLYIMNAIKLNKLTN